VPDLAGALLLAAAFSAVQIGFQQALGPLAQGPHRRRDRLAGLFPDMPWIGAAPVFLVFLGDARRLERLGALRGHRQDNGALEGFFNATVDASLRADLRPGGETLARHLPDQRPAQPHHRSRRGPRTCRTKVFPVAGLCLGYPAQQGSSACVCRRLRPWPRRPLRRCRAGDA
jgi:hypothetical protein